MTVADSTHALLAPGIPAMLVVFALDAQRYALPLDAVERVLRAVAVTPLPNAPPMVRGIIDIAGCPVPVLSLRARFGLADQPVSASDVFLLLRTRLRRVALIADEAQEVLILVAEDNKTNRKLISLQLGLLGYAADVVGDGNDALARWRSGDYALLLTDLHMPGQDGCQLAAAIRAEEAGALRRPIIALTASTVRGEAERCIAAGMDDFVGKPMRPEVLKHDLQKWLPAPAKPPAALLVPDARATLDVGVLAALVGNDPAIIADFLLEYRHSASESMAQLLDAYQCDQLLAVGAAAHKLKSSSRSLGAAALGDLCEQIESAGDGEDAVAIRPLVSLLRNEWLAVNQALETALQATDVSVSSGDGT